MLLSASHPAVGRKRSSRAYTAASRSSGSTRIAHWLCQSTRTWPHSLNAGGRTLSGSGAGAPEASKYTRWPSHSPLAAAANAASTRANEDDAEADADADAEARAGVRGPRARERRGRSDAPPIEARRADDADIARTRERREGRKRRGAADAEAIARDEDNWHGGDDDKHHPMVTRRRRRLLRLVRARRVFVIDIL